MFTLLHVKTLPANAVKMMAVVSRNMAYSGTEHVLGTEHGDKGLITINRPKALNSINSEMVKTISGHLRQWESTKSLVIIKGAGEKSFCAGGDVVALVKAGPTPESKQFFRLEYTNNAIIGNYKIPYIALIDGITMGGGVGLSVHGKYRIATERTLFAMPETAIGLFPDVGGSHFLPKLRGKLGLYLGLTGFRLKGPDVFRAGIATHYCESAKIGDLEKALLFANSAGEVPGILDNFCTNPKGDFVLEKHMDKINQYFSAPTIEGIVENLKKDGSDWAKEQLSTLSKMSPTSLKVTLRELEYGKNMSLEDSLKMEFRLAVHSLEDSDFKEGVRALLIDKDKNPKWNPTRLEDVTESRVNFFFEKLPESEELKLDDIVVNYRHKL